MQEITLWMECSSYGMGHAGQFLNRHINYESDDALQAAIQSVGYTMRHVKLLKVTDIMGDIAGFSVNSYFNDSLFNFGDFVVLLT